VNWCVVTGMLGSLFEKKIVTSKQVIAPAFAAGM
jgi:hypothetical protein